MANHNGNAHSVVPALLLPQRYFGPYADTTIQTENIYDDFTFNFKINYILVVVGFAKIFIILRVVLLRQIYMSPRCTDSLT